MNRIKERNVSLDIIRIIALFSVISVHFFLNIEFYSAPVFGKKMYLMTLVRTFFMICVPLFIVLTGYLMNTKKLCKKYYIGIGKTLGVYILASIVTICYKIVVLDASFTVTTAIREILDFSAIEYAWYVEMYIGLFLLIPFLNIVYHGLGGIKEKRLLLLTMLFLTSIPSITNIWEFDLAGWWKQPSVSNNYSELLPFWWKNLYPITYYFMGCYIREYGVKIKTRLNMILLLTAAVLFGSFNYYRSYNSEFIWGEWQEYNALPNVITTVLVFALILNLDMSRMSLKAKKILGEISNLCFGAYLGSWIFDRCFYPLINERVAYIPNRMWYYILIVPMVFACSLCVSCILEWIYKWIGRFVKSLKKLCKREHGVNL